MPLHPIPNLNPQTGKTKPRTKTTPIKDRKVTKNIVKAQQFLDGLSLLWIKRSRIGAGPWNDVYIPLVKTYEKCCLTFFSLRKEMR